MSPKEGIGKIWEGRAPRMRGDEPNEMDAVDRERRCSPHARG
nr:hypothetical protein [Rothia nasimurium]